MKYNKMSRIAAATISAAFMILAVSCSNTDKNLQSPTPEISGGQREEFVFTRENFPRMDGSTSTAPLAEAAASVLLGEHRSAVGELAIFNRTTQAFRNLAAGLCDILIVSEPTPEVFGELSDMGFEIEIAPIATDALVFIVNTSNPIDNLTTQQLRDIYTGEITNWSEVGGENIKIEPFQRNAEAGSQVLMEKLVMAETPMMPAPLQHVSFGMGDLISAIKSFDGSHNAIGYTVFYYAEDMRMAEGLKIISVDGVRPGTNTIRSGQYPFLNPYYVVIGTNEPIDSPARIMFNWLLSDEGQRLVGMEGYVSMR
ncbi:MAG: substrate-binding domain-containing protein [Oscillospiraceae bacterium]|nr:substrate-binding domain-containing protein [Oscillospiraceae bacterium]